MKKFSMLFVFMILMLLQTSFGANFTIKEKNITVTYDKTPGKTVILTKNSPSVIGWRVIRGNITINNDQFVMPNEEVEIEAIYATANLTVEDNEVLSSGEEIVGNEITVTASASDFSYWGYTGITLTEAQRVSPTITFIMPANDVVLTANYSALFNLTVEDNMISSTRQKSVGEEVTVTASASDFSHWGYIGITLTEAQRVSPTITFIMPANDVVLTANYSSTYTITYDANNGTGAPASQTKTHGVDLTLSSDVPTRDGYNFLGWSTNSSATSAQYTAGGTYTANASTTLYAVWEENTMLMEREAGIDSVYTAIGATRAGKTSYTSDKIKTITLLNSNQVPTTDVVDSWDVSYNNGEGKVMAWLKNNSADSTKYDLYIGGNGGIKAPANSSYLFRDYTNCTVINGLDNLDTANVTNMSYMFKDCSGLTSLNVSNFNTQNTTDMWSMFNGCSGLTSLDLSNLNTQNVTNMQQMFYGCSGLTSLDVSSLNTQNVTNMSSMFYNCSGLTSLNVSNFNTQNVTNMYGMFYGCSGLTSLDVSSLNAQNVTNMRYMFSNCSSLTSLNVSNFDTQNVTDMDGMFSGCRGLTSLNVSNFDTQNVTTMYCMFMGCSGLTSLDVSNLNTQNVTDMGSMFNGCSNLTSLDVSSFNTQNVTNMNGMFSGCSGLTSLDVSNFNTQNVTAMQYMFTGCSGLTSLDLSNFDTQNVTTMYAMFSGCSGLTSLDVSNLNTQNVTNMGHMFNGCSGLTTIYVNPNIWQTATNTTDMFTGCGTSTLTPIN